MLLPKLHLPFDIRSLNPFPHKSTQLSFKGFKIFTLRKFYHADYQLGYLLFLFFFEQKKSLYFYNINSAVTIQGQPTNDMTLIKYFFLFVNLISI